MEIFRKVLLTASYCLDLQEAIEYIFSKVNNTYYTIADIANNIFRLSDKLHEKIAKIDKR